MCRQSVLSEKWAWPFARTRGRLDDALRAVVLDDDALAHRLGAASTGCQRRYLSPVTMKRSPSRRMDE
jgi:hypothetical protein